MESIIDKIEELSKEIPEEKWQELQDAIDREKLVIGDKVIDGEGHIGEVGIMWDDGDFRTLLNDAAHPNPKKVRE